MKYVSKFYGKTDLFTAAGLSSNQTTVYQAQIYSYNLKGRSEVVKLPKITLDAEERYVSFRSFSRFYKGFATNTYQFG